MNLQQMRILLAVIDKGSFAAAGTQVGRSHSAISLQMKGLETELDVVLFDRTVRPPVPTAKAHVLADHARRIVNLCDSARDAVSGQLVRGRLTVGAVPTVLSSFLPAALAELKAAHPDLSFDVRSGSSDALAADLAQGRLDVVVCTKPPRPIAGLDWHHIAHEPLAVIARKDAAGDARDLLRQQPFIWFNRKTWAGAAIEAQLKAQGITVQATMEIDSLDAIQCMVREGLGVAIVPVCRGHSGTWPGLRSVPFGDPPHVRDVGALTMRGGACDALIQTFLRAL
ncbi:HTH-type transcriptional activator CmpR [Roseobacter fucihabitans]|uniref:HTH-type transcriptional activator CmpR n=1 Tax=Roseobacter fucihabitans TaxID=1537242 RepID=A0ABZ2BX31_9RHOB|nr:LysR family transcriptional regulator [Roseobacter litoralis]MBC6964502.1 HTH-type transcriptional activator CmpR [Roseobacter litoralis]